MKVSKEQIIKKIDFILEKNIEIISGFEYVSGVSTLEIDSIVAKERSETQEYVILVKGMNIYLDKESEKFIYNYLNEKYLEQEKRRHQELEKEALDYLNNVEFDSKQNDYRRKYREVFDEKFNKFFYLFLIRNTQIAQLSKRFQ